MIEIDNRQNELNVSQDIIDLIGHAVKQTLMYEGFGRPYEISVVITDNNEIRQINREFRQIDRETDVLSFPMLEYDEGYYEEGEIEIGFEDINPDTGNVVLGDIIISAEKAHAQAIEYGHSVEREIAFLIVHSTLHLLGYDHEEDSDRKIMREKEEDILNILGQVR